MPNKKKASVIPKLCYVMKLYEINKNTIKDFYCDEKQRRMIREGKVKTLIKLMRQGKHFSAPFVSNHTDKRHKLIDGNHRYEAIEKILAMDSNFKIKVWVARYENLSRQQERDVFSDWNIGTKQSAADFLKLYWDTIPKGEEMLRKIPASIYGSANRIKVKTIMGNHIDVQKQNKFTGGYGAGSETVLKDFAKIDSGDVTMAKAFMRDMEQIFGAFHDKEVFWKGTSVATFYRIWYDNKDLPTGKLLDAFREIYLKPSVVNGWKEMAKSGGRAASLFMYNASMPHFELLSAKKKYSGLVFKREALTASS